AAQRGVAVAGIERCRRAGAGGRLQPREPAPLRRRERAEPAWQAFTPVGESQVGHRRLGAPESVRQRLAERLYQAVAHGRGQALIRADIALEYVLGIAAEEL